MARTRSALAPILAAALVAIVAVLAPAPLPGQAAAPGPFRLTIDNIMRGEELIGTTPSDLQWSYDGQVLYFRWKKPGAPAAELYAFGKADAAPRKITAEAMMKRPPASAPGRGRGFGGFGGGAQPVPDKARKRALLVEGGDVKLMDLKTGAVRPLLATDDREAGVRFSFDQKKVVYTVGDNVFAMALDGGELRQMTSFAKRPPAVEPRKTTDIDKWYQDQQLELFQMFKRVGGEGRGQMPVGPPTGTGARPMARRRPFPLAENQTVSGQDLSPDESQVVFTISEPVADIRQTIVPNYVTRSGYTEDIPSRPKAAYSWTRSGRMGLMATTTGEVRWLDFGQGERKLSESFLGWSPDGRWGLVQVRTDDRKDDWLYRLDPASATLLPLETIHDDAWVGDLGLTSVAWTPDAKAVVYVSEKDGFAHIYRVSAEGKERAQLTSGRFEVRDAVLSADGTKIYFTSSEVHPGELHYYVMPAQGGPRTRLTAMTGQHAVSLSPDETTLASIFSTATKPGELYVQPAKPGAAARTLTLSTTEEFRSYAWMEPEVLSFKARDGVDIYARLFRPASANPKRPAVIFIHGAGYLQNAHKGWSTYYREYMFHNLLAAAGYHVLDLDYRGSSGYGRDCRTGVYRFMGGKDLNDVVDGAKFLVESCGVDAGRIGCYGGSYGGFLTLMAMFTAPEAFKAGAALRPVTDWAAYNAGYTVDILNLPQKDAEAYKKSSPLYLAQGLKGALLICHGVVDTNVHVQDSIRLAQRLIELRKENWELALYPSENHSFVNADSWADEYKRIFKLFETNLKN
ncbi:MAG: S9 family peptidase [Candidatus Aminicenantes bacterium]|nr:S9 family peptidase [Candidatus Aminicenantes bacterium]